MLLVFPDEGLLYVLNRIAGNYTDSADGLYWCIYTNDETPDRTTVLADLTIDSADFAPVQIDSTGLPTQGIASDVGSIQGPAINFTNGGGSSVNCYGYAVLDSTQSFLVAAARFDSAPISVASGGALPVIPILQSRSQEP